MNEIRYEAGNGSQPWVVYWVEGEKETYRAAFSTEERAEEWAERYGDRPLQGGP